MPPTFPTADELLLISNQNARDAGCTDVFNDAPFLRALSAIYSSHGTQHQYLKEITAPVVGFRAVNAGFDQTPGLEDVVTIDLKILAASFGCDYSLANAYPKGGYTAYLARKMQQQLRAAFKKVENQIVNGDDNAGFAGLVQALGFTNLENEMVVDAGGVAAEDGPSGLTSVWFLRTDPDERDVNFVMGQGANIEVGQPVVVPGNGSNDKQLPQYFVPCEGWAGLQIGCAKSVARLANVDASTHGVTYNLMSQVLERFPEEKQPNLIVMNRRGIGQLQRDLENRTAAGVVIARPKDYEAINIVSTSSCLNSEERVVAD